MKGPRRRGGSIYVVPTIYILFYYSHNLSLVALWRRKLKWVVEGKTVGGDPILHSHHSTWRDT